MSSALSNPGDDYYADEDYDRPDDDEPCQWCGGSGYDEDDMGQVCDECGGTG